MGRVARWIGAGIGIAVAATAWAQPLLDEAAKLAPLARTQGAKAWIDRADDATIPPDGRVFWARFRPNRAISAEAYAALPESEREGWEMYEVTPDNYHATFYGSGAAYLGAIDAAAQAMGDSPTVFHGAKVLDLGYGQIAQLEMLAACGADVLGVDVDPILTMLYQDSASPRDIANPQGESGSVRVAQCLWPNEEACRDDVGGGYDLILSRNLLKRGFVKPKEPVGGFTPVAHGLSDEEACRSFFDALAPGGVLVVYSIGPAFNPEQPWSDIANPWPREAWEAAGFEVVHHEADVSAFDRQVFVLLGYGEADDLERTLFGVCSVYRRPAGE